ncbi:ATP-binding protein [Microbacterium sp. 2P01SA-2]|uniref:BbrUII/HgiDII family restriction enzyme n=1 Tax=unclassified Microbacterium TaxID=2609290 RepID=UPI00399F2811
MIAADGAAQGAEPPEDTTYKMTVELSVLESLGINLYSNAAAVLSELVANAYDADAGKVSIRWQPETQPDGSTTGLMRVIVSDDGAGMGVSELNRRFLKAGYKKRENEGTVSPRWGRAFMGRKGIGKLSVFSLAREVEVYSKLEGGEACGLRIRVSDLEERIKAERDYYPQPVPVPPDYDRQGTTLVLSDLKSKRADLTASALRKRLARRFDVLDETPPGAGGFQILVNDKPITWADRQELKKLQFIWEFGSQQLEDKVLPRGIQRFVIPSSYVDEGRGWRIKGWFGTTETPTDLTDDDEAGSLKNIIVLARKRPIQEGIIEKLDFSRLFGNYVTGQVEADFLDLDEEGYDDIATSDRQRLIEDDERVVALQRFLRSAFVRAAEQWSEARPKKASVNALDRYPRLQEWITDLPPWQQGSATAMVGTIAGLELEGKNAESDRAALFRSGVLAFARVGLRKSADDLEKLSSVNAVDLLPLLGQQDVYEAGLWVDILRSRIDAIEKLQTLTDDDEKEQVLQQHLFDHLWLLDASWERATGSETMEENLRKIASPLFAKEHSDLDEEITGRIDIRYRTLNNRHVIVELKRYGLTVDAKKLADQGAKYARALASILAQQQRQNEIPNIEVIFVLGRKPGDRDRVEYMQTEEQYFASEFQSFNGSFRLYDELVDRARNQYQQYLDASTQARALDELMEVLDERVDAGEDVASEVTPASEVPVASASPRTSIARAPDQAATPAQAPRALPGPPPAMAPRLGKNNTP